MVNERYLNIDLERTGTNLKRSIQQAGYTVKDIQKKLMLSCPQPIYRWYQGKVLPSVNHLYVLSNLLHVHMEELLVPHAACTAILYILQYKIDRFAIAMVSWEELVIECSGTHISDRIHHLAEEPVDFTTRTLTYMQGWQLGIGLKVQ